MTPSVYVTELVSHRVYVTGYADNRARTCIDALDATLTPVFVRIGSRWYLDHSSADATHPEMQRWHTRIVSHLNANGERHALQQALARN